MSKVFIFNPASLEQREVTENDADRAVNELGWVRVGGANALLAIYHPGRNDHKMILERDLPAWEQKGYYASPTMIFHPQEGPITVSAEKALQMVGKGWYESPADFPKADQEALRDEVAKSLQTPTLVGGGSIVTVPQPTLEMKKDELLAFAKEWYDLVLDEKLTKAQILAAIEEKAVADQASNDAAA